MSNFSRRSMLAAMAVAPFFHRVAHAAKFRLKLSLNTPADHPVTVRSLEASARISEATGGAVQIDVFPNSQLGGDTDALSQLRSGALEMQSISGGILANLVAGANLYNTAFAFPDRKTVWNAMDGTMGEYLGSLIARVGLHAHGKVWDNGYRQCTTSTQPIEKPSDFDGMKFRVAPALMLVSVFKSLGASPVTINIAETYSALQTRVVDGQENGLALIETLKLNEVQKYCSLTNHMWDGFFLLFNGRVWKRMPEDIRSIITAEFDKAILKQREDLLVLEGNLQEKLQSSGLVFNQPDSLAIKDALAKTGYYKEWQEKFGEEAWSILTRYTGPLA